MFKIIKIYDIMVIKVIVKFLSLFFVTDYFTFENCNAPIGWHIYWQFILKLWYRG